jgi:metal-dependent amidase/aminoacylase/carboxypeptidase family protein
VSERGSRSRRSVRGLPDAWRVLGTPAEERGCGKELMAREGALAGVDAAMMMHPASINLVNMPCVCMSELDVVYRGSVRARRAMPERGINALDALVLAYQGVAALRQHIRPTERIHGIFTDGGQAPERGARARRGPLLRARCLALRARALKPRVEGCFRAGAAATGAELELRWGVADYLDIRFNDPLASAFRANAEQLGRQFFPYDKLPTEPPGQHRHGQRLAARSRRSTRCSPAAAALHDPQREFSEVGGLGDGRRRGDRRREGARDDRARLPRRRRAARAHARELRIGD